MRTIAAISFAALAVAGLSLSATGQENQKPSDLTIHIRDYCDPASFDAVLGNGACTRDTSTGSITFMGFLTELSMGSAPGDLHLRNRQLVKVRPWTCRTWVVRLTHLPG